ncbi:MAG: aldehyde dehydrogenase family protein [Clostridia bacterium]|nr:aldehyde dehydrogenase family protein [Clostridia bacterium]
MIEFSRPFIGGGFRRAHSGDTFTTINPSTGEAIADVEKCDGTDVDAAVEAARSACSRWRFMKAEQRASVLRGIAQALRNHNDELAMLDTLDAGIPYVETKQHDVARSAALFEYSASVIDKLYGNTVPIDPKYMSLTFREPFGVVAAITPWNAPLANAVISVAPALACGNTVVLKPASESPLSALMLAKVCADAGLPEGVLNVIPGPGSDVGMKLASHPGVDKLCFTGSVETGQQILQCAAENMKECNMELGGKTPVVVFEDADIEAAAKAVSFSAFRRQGQICTAAARLFLHEKIADRFIDLLLAHVRELRVGDPTDMNTQIGPMISLRQRASVLEYIAKGRKEGATLLIGGGPPETPALARGAYMTPTIFTDVDHSSSLAQDEIFGPVLCIFRFSSEDEVLRTANDVRYGLGASVWTKGIERAHFFVRGFEAGLVWVNCINLSHPAIPAGGFKMSGLGLENGMEAMLRTYSRSKTAWFNLGDRAEV